MARYDNAHSRVVAGLKIALPLVAVAILSVLFLLARTIQPAQNIPYADIDAADLAREQRIGNPTFATQTDSGALLQFTATSARPDPNDPAVIFGQDLIVSMQAPAGDRLELLARDGVLDGTSETVELGGGVTITSSAGYRIETDRMAARMDATLMETGSAVTAEGPLGRLEAGKMRISLIPGSDSYVLVFNAGVKLVYTPE
jgi:lipopolysaccharide export system protein LptC